MHRLHLLLILPFSAFVLACSGPGGGGNSGYVNPCAFNPQLPQCGGADAVGDGVTGDAGATDTGSDNGSTNTDVNTGCSDEAPPRCNGNDVEMCIAGTYEVVTTCPGGTACIDGECVGTTCVPDCNGKDCGEDGCGGVCGTCNAGETCTASGICQGSVCTPNCAGKSCGDDGCGGFCGECQPDYSCNANGQCEFQGCTPDCSGKECGSDGCGGSCGNCPNGWSCQGNTCIESACTPDCSGKNCGDDGCGGSCGSCGGGQSCINGVCQTLGGGGDDCSTLLSCFGDCQDAACQQACLDNGSADGVAKLNAFLGCGPDCQDLLCVINAGCSDEGAACFHNNSGFGGCNALLGCASACPSGDSICLDGCYAQASAQAQALELEINWCLLNYCDATDSACIQSAAASQCASYVAACQNN